MSLRFVTCDIFPWPCRIDPHLPGMPIVYASDAFLKLTGALILIEFKILSNIDLISYSYFTSQDGRTS